MDRATPAPAAAAAPGAAATPPSPPPPTTSTPPRVYIPGHTPHRRAYLPAWLVAPEHDNNSGHGSSPASPPRAVDRATSLPSLATVPTAVAPAAEPDAHHAPTGPNERRSAASSAPLRPRVAPRQTLLRSLSSPSHLASFVTLNVDRLPPPPPVPPADDPVHPPPPHLFTDSPVRASPTVSLRSRGGSNASAFRPGTPTSSARVAPSPTPARAPVKGILRRRVGRMLVETPTSDAGTDRTPRAAMGEGNRWPSLTASESTFRTAPTHPLLASEWVTAPMAPHEDQEVPVVPAVHFDAAPPSVRLSATGTPSTASAPTPTPGAPAPVSGASLHPPSPLGASLRPPSPLGVSLRPPSPITPGLGSRRASFDPDAVANEATIFELLPAAEPPPRAPTESSWTRCWHAVTACCRPKRARKEGKVEVLFSCVVLARVDRVSVMAEGGRKKADADAFWSEYNAFVVRVVEDGEGVEGVGVGGASYAVHLCRVQSTSPKRPLKVISLDHARLSLANPSDGSLSLAPRGQPDRFLLHAPSAALASALYMVLWQAVPRALRWPAPIAVDVHVPDLDLAIRFSCHPYTPTLAECHAAALDALHAESDSDPHVRAWLARAPHQLAWRRGDRIEWIDVTAPGLESVVAPYSIEKTHALELRAVGPHRADAGDATQCEGYLKRHWSSWVGPRARRVYAMVVLHEYVFFLAAPPDRVTPTASAASWTESMARRPFAVVDSRARARGCVVPGAEFLRLEDILSISVPRPCAECRAKLAALTHVADGAGTRLVQLANEDADSAAPPHFHVVTRHTVLDLSAETHTALHAWVELVAHAVVADRWTRARLATAYARTLEHNAEVYATELHAREDLLAAMTASPALWPRGLTDPGNVVKCAHGAYVKSRFRGWFRPVLVLVTDDHVVVCERRKGSGMWTPKRWIAVHARTHVLVGAVDPKTGVGVRDEAAGGVGGVPAKWFGGGPAAPVASPGVEEDEEVSATAVAPTASLSRAGTPASLLPPSRSPDPFLRGAPASMMPIATPSPTTVTFPTLTPTTAASLPRPPATPTPPPPAPVVVTRHESAHQTCFTLWSPPARGDVVKAAARRGKVHVVQCRQKWERDQLVVAIEAVVARKVVEAVGEEQLRAIVAGATAGVRGTAADREHELAAQEHDVAGAEQQDGRREEWRHEGGAAGTAAAGGEQ
ncbi:hypothetical protein GGF32_005590 [Allomyces javanicus]|nr:hypothetical protein GGF32_005590 [Allomyces javanicus]